MNTTNALEIRNLTKKIGSRTIIDNLSLDVPRGEIFGLLGPNGAGKTTIIRMIVGLMAPTAGEISINGINVQNDFEQAIRQVGAIVENPELYKFLSGYNNLIHFARMAEGVTPERIDEVVALVKLEDRIQDRVKTYSLGMRQRLGVAQAILHRPSVLILDEPTNGLDPAGIRELRDYLRYLVEEEGTTVVVSSHLLSEMELMCDRVAIIQHGRLVGVKVVGEMVQEEGEKVQVQFDVDQPAKVEEALTELDWKVECKVGKQGVTLPLQKEQVAQLNAKLVAMGVNVYGIKATAKTLEDRFLEMTGGEGNV